MYVLLLGRFLLCGSHHPGHVSVRIAVITIFSGSSNMSSIIISSSIILKHSVDSCFILLLPSNFCYVVVVLVFRVAICGGFQI